MQESKPQWQPEQLQSVGAADLDPSSWRTPMRRYARLTIACRRFLAQRTGGTELLRSAADERPRMWPISRRVNRTGSRDDDPTVVRENYAGRTLWWGGR